MDISDIIMEMDNAALKDEWFKKTVPSRWVFDDHQLEFIDKTLHKMWEEYNA